jgi:hypothetical protein
MINSIVFLVMPRSLEWNIFFGFSFFESPPIRLDKFQGVGQKLERTPLDSFIRFPFVLIETPNYGNSRAFVEIFGRHVCQFLETNHFDPSGFLLS